jgi:hypothetical protein
MRPVSERAKLYPESPLSTLTRVPSAGLVLLLIYAGIVAGGAAACSKAPADAPAAQQAQPRGTDRLQPQYDAGGKLQKLEYDRNGDGKVDTWGYMDGTRVVRVEVDENGDGTVDRWEFHRADAPASATPGAPPVGVDKTVEHIERATKHDGKVSRWDYFTDGALVRVEEDTNGDGKVDKWETYVNGSLSVMALDTQGRGTPDRRLVYGPDGSFDHMEADPTGSGTFSPIKP